MFMPLSFILGQNLSKDGEKTLDRYKQTIEVVKLAKPGSFTYTSKLDQAEKYISKLKQSDPSFETTQLEEEVKKFRESAGNSIESEKKEAENRVSMNAKKSEDRVNLKKKEGKLNLYLIKTIPPTEVPEEVEDNRKKITEFESEFSDFIKNQLLADPDDKNSLVNIEKQCQQSADNDKISDYKKYAKESSKTDEAINEFLQIKFIKIKWNLLSEAYPASTILKNIVAQANDAINNIGGEEGVKKIVNANRMEKAKTVKMQAAVGSDPTTVNQLKAALTEFYNTKGKPVLKVHLLSAEWNYNKHPVTGVILNRYKPFQIAYKDSDGFCRLFTDRIQQDYNGSGYGKGYIVNGPYMGGYADILCENVK